MYGKGYITLLTIIIVAAILTYSITMLLILNMNSSQNTNYYYIGNQNYYIAHACSEDALFNIRQNTNYSGSNTLNIFSGDCSYTVLSGVGQNRLINITSNFKGSTKKIKYTVNPINPKINIINVEEVETF